MIYYARSKKHLPEEEWQTLPEHLFAVAGQAKKFAEPFASGEWAYLCGLLHDIGKYSLEFQRRLRGERKVDHSLAGALEAKAYITAAVKSECLGNLIAHVISAHHTGLADGEGGGNRSLEGGFSTLSDRLAKAGKIPAYSVWQHEISLPESPGLPLLPPAVDRHALAFSLYLWAKMLYSCLVDADRLNAEEDREPDKTAKRGQYPALEVLHERLNGYLEGKAATCQASPVNVRRAEVLQACRTAGARGQGIFSLTVPTGGGKTLSSLAFALEHAKRHGLARIIYVIPYTSIIEQTADVFRAAFGGNLAHAVVEHHSDAESLWNPKDGKEVEDSDDERTLAWENWDAPILVTTAVQFFESLFAAKSSRCRKLHHIASSVVILDEAQTLPTAYFRPCLAMLRALSEGYKTSIVLCTATQPQVGVKPWLKEGFSDVQEIIENVPDLFRALKRVEVRYLGKLEDEKLVALLFQHRQALCIVNTRAHARRICESLLKRINIENICTLRKNIQADSCHEIIAGGLCPPVSGKFQNESALEKSEAVFHLSTWMCPAHRKQVLHNIRNRLKDPVKPPCFVVSTSLLEAGVDISFPVVFRAASGLDSIAQAAGRSNREGENPQGGIVYVFDPPDESRGEQQRRLHAGQMALRAFADPISPEATAAYFDNLHNMVSEGGLDRKNILQAIGETGWRGLMPYRSVAEDFKLIDDGGSPVIIPWDEEARKAVAELEYGVPDRALSRRLQRWCVNVRQDAWNALKRSGAIQPRGFAGQWHVLENKDLYHSVFGLDTRDPFLMKAESLVL